MPQDATSPAPGTAEVIPAEKSFDDSVEDISNLLGDPETDPAEDDQDQAKADDAEPDDESDEAEAEDVDEDSDDSDDTDEDGQPVKGGRFAPDSAKVKMPDGRVITVGELREFGDSRAKDFQRAFTEKSTAHARDVEAFKAEKSEVEQYAQSLSQYRDYLSWFAETNMPKDPGQWTGNAIADPAGFIKWQEDAARFRSVQEAYRAFQMQKEEDAKHKQRKSEQDGQTRLQGEARKLEEAFPVLRNPDKRRGFWERLEAGASKYFGISADEVRTVADHRMIKALHAAVDRERLREKAPQVREEIKRPIPKSGHRADPKAQGAREKQVRSERLRRDGSLEAGIAALESFDL